MSRLSTIIVLLSLTAVSFSASSKRGLCYVDSLENTADSTIWFKEPTSLTWYYNYGSDPTPAIDSALEFVPMLWGPPASNYNFTADIIALLRDNKVPVKYVLGFNEPDLPKNVGGSDITPVLAAELWKDWIEPLAKEGLKLGAPGVSSALDGKKWLKEFLDECKNCTIDFIPLHWYGNFLGFSSYIGEMRAMFPDKDMWVTELGNAHVDLQETTAFFNSSTEYLDRLDYVDRYSWFGAFRSDASNIGPNGAMLDKDGKLTDIGASYLGREPTGNKPGSGAGRLSVGWGLVVTLMAAMAAW